MSSIVAGRDDSQIEAQGQDTTENEPNLAETEPERGSELGSGPVETEAESIPEREAPPGDGEEKGIDGSDTAPVEAKDGASGGETDLVETEEPAASGSSPVAVVEEVAASDTELGHDGGQEAAEEKKRRRRLVLLLAVVLLAVYCTLVTFWRYVNRPAPLPDLLPVPVDVNYPPRYLFSIYGMDKPVGVALSPQGDRIYVTESSGERLVKVFDRDGTLLASFAPPRTGQAERSPVYVATDGSGRVLVSDRLQHSLFVYDREGRYLDTILGPALTLSEYVSKHTASLRPGASFAYNAFEADLYYQWPGDVEHTLPAPDLPAWSPLGVRIDGNSKMLVTDVPADRHVVREIPADVVLAASWQDFDPPEKAFGTCGQGNGQFLFPNVAVSDSRGQIYVTDGNNGRISVWDDQGGFLFSFGQGAGEGGLNLPRGAAIDARDRLHVVDAVGQNVKVYDVSGSEPNFLFVFGDLGLGDGQFNYPNDIALDASGRLYITDRENNRVQVWSY